MTTSRRATMVSGRDREPARFETESVARELVQLSGMASCLGHGRSKDLLPGKDPEVGPW